MSIADRVNREADAVIKRVADTHCSERGYWLRKPHLFLREVAARAYIQGIYDAILNRENDEAIRQDN